MQVPIPKEVIDEIIEKYHCTTDEAARAYIASKEKAEKVFMESLQETLDEKRDKQKEGDLKLFTPAEIKQHLDKYVIGQEEYKKRICIAAAYHFAMIQHLRRNSKQSEVIRFRKKNTIIAGPSGSGKTYCIEVLGDLLNVPALIVDATDYTESGYVGKSADDMIRELVDMTSGSNQKEQVSFINKNGGIIFIDEIDKKAKQGSHAGTDISREGFQRSVLKLIERKLIPVDNPYSPASQIQEAIERQQGVKSNKKEKMIGTENILFILGGSFERSVDNLESIVKKRIEQGGNFKEDGTVVIRGFGDYEKEEKKQYKNYYREAGSEDYIRFGLLPELVGRAPIRTFVNLLSKNDLIRIMKDTEDSILSQYQMEFRLFNIELEFVPDAIDYVAELAENRKTGARALVSVLESVLTDFQFELPGTNFTNLTVDRALCERPKDALLKMLKKSPFVDFIESFKHEYGIELIFDEGIQNYIEETAAQKNMELSATIAKLLSGVFALNYMNFSGPVKITKEMLDDEKYFDKMFTEWYIKKK